LDSQQNSILKVQERTDFNYAINKREVIYANTLILSKPEILRLRVAETRCPKGHSVKMIKLFALEDKVCPQHNVALDKSAIFSQLEVYSIYVQTKEAKMNVFIPSDKLTQELDIYNKINVKGYDVSVAGKSKGIFTRGVFVTESQFIEKSEEEKANQKSMLSKYEVVDLFLSNLPKLNYPDDVWNGYKHGLLLSLVYNRLNILVIGEPASNKTETALQMKEIAGGAFIDSTNATDVGLIGMAVRNYNDSGYHFEGGAVFSAKSRALYVDEMDKVAHFSFFRHLNSITGNNFISFRKGNVAYEDTNFFVSFVGFGNPLHTYFSSPPREEIKTVFRHNKEFLSRMHLMFGIKGDKQKDIPSRKKKLAIPQISVYINQARQMNVTEDDITPEAESEMQVLYKENINDSRFYKKLTDLVIAEAKFSLDKKVKVEHVKEVEKLLSIQNRLLHGF
jgi:hypothetical protein